MKIYVKPTIEILELRVNENMASATYPGDTGSLTPITKYTLGAGTYATSQ